MHLIKNFLLFLVLLLVIGACKWSPENGKEAKFLAAGIYDSTLVEAEFSHLSSLDTNTLSEIEKQAVSVRIEDLKKTRELLEAYGNIIIIGNRCYPDPRVPPGPCPVAGDIQSYIPEGTEIDLDLIGVFTNIPENPESRISQELGSMQLTSVDGKKVFADGTWNAYDKLFSTAWYHFDVKNPELANQPLILKIRTVIILNGQVQNIVMEIPVSAGTFLPN